MSCWSLVVLLIFIALAESAEAKRGCVNFGHSCYGGMGKRTSEVEMVNDEEDLQTDPDPAYVFTGPRTGYKPLQTLTPQQYEHISQVIMQWIRNHKQPLKELQVMK